MTPLTPRRALDPILWAATALFLCAIALLLLQLEMREELDRLARMKRLLVYVKEEGGPDPDPATARSSAASAAGLAVATGEGPGEDETWGEYLARSPLYHGPQKEAPAGEAGAQETGKRSESDASETR